MYFHKNITFENSFLLKRIILTSFVFIWRIVCILCFLWLTGCNNPPLQGYVEGEYIYLASPFSGQLKQLFVSRGDEVKAGQLLYALDSEPEASDLQTAKQQLDQAEQVLLDLSNGQRDTVIASIIAQRDQAKASLALSTQDLERYKNLYAQKALDRATLDKAESAYQRDLNLVQQYSANLEEAKKGARTNAIQAQQAAVAAAKATVEKATWQLAQKTLYAPVTGRIFDTYYKIGEFVNVQQPVLSLLAPTDIKVIFYVPESRRSEILVGKPVFFTCDQCKHTFTATISYLSPQAEYTPPVIYSHESRQKLVYRVEAKLSPAEAIQVFPGQPVDVFVHAK